jgi:hypothetical protein
MIRPKACMQMKKVNGEWLKKFTIKCHLIVTGHNQSLRSFSELLVKLGNFASADAPTPSWIPKTPGAMTITRIVSCLSTVTIYSHISAFREIGHILPWPSSLSITGIWTISEMLLPCTFMIVTEWRGHRHSLMSIRVTVAQVPSTADEIPAFLNETMALIGFRAKWYTHTSMAMCTDCIFISLVLLSLRINYFVKRIHRSQGRIWFKEWSGVEIVTRFLRRHATQKQSSSFALYPSKMRIAGHEWPRTRRFDFRCNRKWPRTIPQNVCGWRNDGTGDKFSSWVRKSQGKRDQRH